MSVNSPELIVSSLGSGSNGNAFLVEHGDQRLLIDAGVPIRTLLSGLKLRGLTASDLSAVLISHEHSDHIRALPSLLRKARLPVLATRGSHAGISNVLEHDRHVIAALSPFSLGELTVTPVPHAHDAREPVGFSVSTERATLTIMSDIGEVNDVNAEFAASADHLIIESNYDERMLRSGDYPAYLKKRIRSSGGHLSNDDCASFLREVVSERTSSIWLCHLSENNNLPDIARDTSTQSLKAAGMFREIIPLPRYDGTIVTWRASDRREVVQQSSFLGSGSNR